MGIRERTLGPDHPGVAASLSNLATLIAQTGDMAGARPLFERALKIREKALGPDHPDVAKSLNGLANLLYRTGDMAGARPLYERALKINEKALGPDHPAVATSLQSLAWLLQATGDYAGARPFYERALKINEKALGPDHPAVATSLHSLAWVLHKTGDYAAARPLYERALKIQEKALGPYHPDVAGTLIDLGYLLLDTGDYAGARPLYERALKINEKALGPEHPAVATSLNNLALLLYDTGDYAGARPLYERALKIREKALGPDHPDVAQSLNNLANLLRDTGDYAGARPLSERALKIREKALGPEHPDVAWSLNSLAWLLQTTGDYAGARPLCERALKIQEKALGPDHPAVAGSLNVLANLLSVTGDYAGARPLYERALKIREKALGPDHPDVATSLNNLAILLQATGDYAGARPLYERALKIKEKALGPDHRSVAYGLNNLADLLKVTSDYAGARPLYERALKIFEKALGPDHPDVARSLNNLAGADYALGQSADALDRALRSELIGREHLRLTCQTLPERQALRYAAVRASGLDLALSLAGRGLDAASRGRVWDALLRSRSLILDEVAKRHRQASQVTRCSREFASASERLANLIVRGPGAATVEAYRRLLDGAKDEREAAERRLAESCTGFGQELARSRLGITEVERALPPGAALVAFARYKQVDPRPGAPDLPSYLGFVLPASDANPEAVALGAAADIDSLVARWKEAIEGTEPAYRTAGEALRRRVWDPIAARLGGAARAFIVPDGALNLVNFAALPAGESAYLLESGPLLHYLSTERDLVPSEGEPARAEGLLAVGGPAFDRRPIMTAAAVRGGGADEAYRGERPGCGEFRDLQFPPLPASLREVEDIASLWTKASAASASRLDVTKLAGAAATEAAFKRDAPGRRVLHLATHGFFLGGRCPSALENQRAIGGVADVGQHEPSPVTGDSPLVLSGLALAGANQREQAPADQDDGILTAEEIAALDLSGVDWAVLSACETGVGEVRAGEGVFGLRRAFQVAGAKTLILSLWAVEDESARQWMERLYEGRWVQHLGTAEAVREASLDVLRERRAKGLSTHPFYWGAFVAAGDWR